MAVLDTVELKKQLEKSGKVKYFMGVDMVDDKVKAYCLVRKIEGEIDTFILAKQSTNEKNFIEEVNNLAKYFNATIIKEI